MPKKEIGPQTVSRVLRGADYFGSADQKILAESAKFPRNFREVPARYPRGVHTPARGVEPPRRSRLATDGCRGTPVALRGVHRPPLRGRPRRPVRCRSAGGRRNGRRLAAWGARRRASPPGPPRVETAHSRIDTCPVGAAWALARPRSGARARQVWSGRGVRVRVGTSLVHLYSVFGWLKRRAS